VNGCDHLGEGAELLALGALEPEEARAIERHVSECADCAARLAEAQLTAASLSTVLPAARPSAELDARVGAALRGLSKPRGLRRGLASRRLAVAAAFILICGGAAFEAMRGVAELVERDTIVATLARSHFDHAAMTPLAGISLTAKVIYGKPPATWLYIVVDEPERDLRAVARTSEGAVDLGLLAATRKTASLFTDPHASVTSVELHRAGITVASARLTR
jgi:hypothetical protein